MTNSQISLERPATNPRAELPPASGESASLRLSSDVNSMSPKEYGGVFKAIEAGSLGESSAQGHLPKVELYDSGAGSRAGGEKPGHGGLPPGAMGGGRSGEVQEKQQAGPGSGSGSGAGGEGGGRMAAEQMQMMSVGSGGQMAGGRSGEVQEKQQAGAGSGAGGEGGGRMAAEQMQMMSLGSGGQMGGGGDAHGSETLDFGKTNIFAPEKAESEPKSPPGAAYENPADASPLNKSGGRVASSFHQLVKSPAWNPYETGMQKSDELAKSSDNFAPGDPEKVRLFGESMDAWDAARKALDTQDATRATLSHGFFQDIAKSENLPKLNIAQLDESKAAAGNYNPGKAELSLSKRTLADKGINLVGTGAHEVTHHEQMALMARYAADQANVGVTSTPEQRQQITDTLGPLAPAPAVLDDILATRNGQTLSPEQASRAGTLLKDTLDSLPEYQAATAYLNDRKTMDTDQRNLKNAEPEASREFLNGIIANPDGAKSKLYLQQPEFQSLIDSQPKAADGTLLTGDDKALQAIVQSVFIKADDRQRPEEAKHLRNYRNVLIEQEARGVEHKVKAAFKKLMPEPDQPEA